MDPLRFTTSRGIPVAYWPGERGCPVLFVHGHVGDHQTLSPAYRPWCGRRPLAALDLPWHGEAPRPDEPDVAHNARAIAEALAALGWERCRLVGHSAGCSDLVRVAAAEPARVDAMLFIAPTGEVEAAGRTQFLGFAELLRKEGLGTTVLEVALARWFSAGYRALNPDLTSRLAAELARQEPMAVARALEAFAMSPALLPLGPRLREAGIRIDALVMSQDAAAPHSESRTLLEAVGANVTTLEGGHRPFDEVSGPFQSALGRFLD